MPHANANAAHWAGHIGWDVTKPIDSRCIFHILRYFCGSFYVCVAGVRNVFFPLDTHRQPQQRLTKKRGQIILFIFICEWILWGFRKGSHPNSSSLFIFSWQPHKHDELWPRLSLSTDTINWFSCAGTQRLGACRLTSTHRVIKEMWLNSFGNNIYVHVVPFESNMTLLYMLL